MSPKKTALIFGGSRGIGAAIARQLAQDGFWVAITYVSQSDKARQVVTSIEASGGRAMAIQANSADPDTIRRAVRDTVDRFGKLDTAIVNAGVLKRANIEYVTLDDLDVSLAINVRGVFLAIQAAAMNMKDGGRIVTIGSNTAVRTGSSGGIVYAMTKAAVAAMVKGAALDFAPRSITVNNIQPGPTETDMTASMLAGLVNVIPLKRVGQPDEIAALASYLVSEKAGYAGGSVDPNRMRWRRSARITRPMEEIDCNRIEAIYFDVEEEALVSLFWRLPNPAILLDNFRYPHLKCN